ncbi:MAG TPA: amidohydrolase family protein [Chthonomonadaceae bacterium]|nr:amidohydrolase family protein [Chthonomonadaceae bacterium]
MRIDAHQHFWMYEPEEYGWITGEMKALRRNFLPGDLAPLLRQIGFDGSIAVQARQSLEETEWLLTLSEQYDFIRGVVGWVDLRSTLVRKELETLAPHPKLCGVRHIVQDEPDDAFLLRPEFLRGLALLQDFGLAYDLLLYPRHLPVAVKVVEKFPGQTFVLDHLAKPAIKDRALSPWREDLQALARFPNVYCKLSGMVTETHWGRWQAQDFQPYLESALVAFGPERLMIGSDWPVCTLSGDYASVMGIVNEFLKSLPEEASQQILGANCLRAYRLNEE